MVQEDNLKHLHTNQRVLIEALISKGASISIENIEKELVKVSYNGAESYLLDRFNEKVPFNWVVLTASKIFVKNLLIENNISVPYGDVFTGHDKNIVPLYAKELGYPLVFKPDWGSHGDFVYSNIRTQKELKEIINNFVSQRTLNTKFIVEEYFEGFEHRIFITQKGDYAILKREPAHIIGDGIQKISEIIEKENKRRIKLKKNINTSLCPIMIDEHVIKHLKRQALTLDSIPSKGKKIYLRLTSNIAKGGISHNMTDAAHPSVIEIARKVAKLIPLPFMGIDFITKDISKPQNIDTYRIIEVNSSPGFAMHLLPIVGEPINVGEYAIKVLFE